MPKAVRRLQTPVPARRLLAALVAFRVALPLAVLAATGSSLPGLPSYTYDARPGDAYGFYSGMRELLKTTQGLGPLLVLVAVALVGVTVVLVWRWRSSSAERPWVVVAGAFTVGAVATLLAVRSHASGATTIGWPLVWSAPLLPYRALGLPLNPDIAFGVGLALSLVANAVTVVATYFAGLFATGRRTIGLLAAGLFSFWPLIVLLIGNSPATNGGWQIDLGLSLYTEPLSTALVATAGALLLRPSPSPLRDATAGVLLGLAVSVRLSNAVIAACACAVLAIRSDFGRVLPLAAGGCAFLPLVVAYWPKGYGALPNNGVPEHPFSLSYVTEAWGSHSLIWGFPAILALVPLAVVGALTVTRWKAALLSSWIIATVAFYSTYNGTDIHPRFLYVILPSVFVLWSAGLAVFINALRLWREAAP